MKCPKCGHTNCQYVSQTSTSSKGYGICKGICGGALLGPIGLLCGLCGTGTTSATNEYWVCQDCGVKFDAADAEREMQKKIPVRFYMEHKAELPEFEFDEKVRRFMGIYESLVANTPLARKILVRDDNSNVFFVSQKRSCDKELIQKETLLFAVPGELGLIVSVDGLFVGDVFLKHEDVSTIGTFGKVVYINQYGLLMGDPDTSEDVKKLLLSFLIKAKDAGKFSAYEEALKLLQTYPRPKADSRSYFSVQKEYEDYIKQLYERKMVIFSQKEPSKYREFCEIEERKKSAQTKVTIAIVAISIFIALIRWGMVGFLSGAIWGALTFLVLYFVQFVYFDGEKWTEHEKRLLPEEVQELKHEMELEPMKRSGTINEIYLYKKYGEIKKAVKKCPNCGTELDRNGNFCNKCGTRL